ncbi:hypothetical protein VHEMI06722 [[Torrubiella] hemipterigena]|uniref:Copper-fist domain-containing protein n=1 Tax=[Torrubiella] hemipterigena TaxID=1531966 RepID=A0A0A1T849_9HYPO|nr:hypothetical protein VHEMI06722 [[Torrubiella] hemipterigena]
MIINGEKYACEACVRGHRVSNCQHSDRPLQHINKKGRPISQCHHCRQMRKSRAAHIKCDCGEKTSKCAHLQPTVEGHTETCCCNHGGRCTCAHKKEPSLGTVPESDSEREALAADAAARPKPPVRRRRANTVHSEAGLTFDQNGNHKPVTKHNRCGQKTDAYLSRVNSVTSAGSLGSSEDMMFGEQDALPSTETKEQRRVKSEAASPMLSSSASSFAHLNGLPPLDLSRIDYPSYSNDKSFDLFPAGMGDDGPIFSAGLSAASVDWSHYDLSESKTGSFAPSSYSQTGAQSFNGMFEFGSGSEQLPTLANTTSTSGDVSEAEDFMSGADGDVEGFLRQNMDLSSIDYDRFYKNAEQDTMIGCGGSLVEEDPAFWMPNYNENRTTADETSDALGAADVNSFWEM